MTIIILFLNPGITLDFSIWTTIKISKIFPPNFNTDFILETLERKRKKEKYVERYFIVYYYYYYYDIKDR